jgi:hypothetical protein
VQPCYDVRRQTTTTRRKQGIWGPVHTCVSVQSTCHIIGLRHVAHTISYRSIVFNTSTPLFQFCVRVRPSPRSLTLCLGQPTQCSKTSENHGYLRGTLVVCVLEFPWSLVHLCLLERASHPSSQPPPGQLGISRPLGLSVSLWAQ